jgi:hypothetical protein
MRNKNHCWPFEISNESFSGQNRHPELHASQRSHVPCWQGSYFPSQCTFNISHGSSRDLSIDSSLRRRVVVSSSLVIPPNLRLSEGGEGSSTSLDVDCSVEVRVTNTLGRAWAVLHSAY